MQRDLYIVFLSMGEPSPKLYTDLLELTANTHGITRTIIFN